MLITRIEVILSYIPANSLILVVGSQERVIPPDEKVGQGIPDDFCSGSLAGTVNHSSLCYIGKIIGKVIFSNLTFSKFLMILVEDSKKIKGNDLAEADDIKKMWQEYSENQYEKGVNNLDNHDDVKIHLEPDILESEVKCTLGSITMNKASGGDGISDELHKILKMMLKCCTQYVSGLENSTMAIRLKKLVLIPIPKNCNAREHSNYCTIVLI